MRCIMCGNEVPDHLKICPHCGAIHRVDKSSMMRSIIKAVVFLASLALLGLVAFGINYILRSNEQLVSSTVANQITANVPTPSPTPINKDEYISNCESFSYNDLARYPDQYKGYKVKFTGRVIQAVEGDADIFRVAYAENKDDIEDYKKIVYVEYYRGKNTRILENDFITIYGEYSGLESYSSIFLSQVTIPKIKARFIDIDLSSNK